MTTRVRELRGKPGDSTDEINSELKFELDFELVGYSVDQFLLPLPPPPPFLATERSGTIFHSRKSFEMKVSEFNKDFSV